MDFGVRDWYVADMKREMERSRSDAVREYWGHVVERVEAEGRTLDGMLNGRVGVDDVRVRVAEARSIMKVAIGTLPEGVRGKLAGQERLLDYLVGVMNSGRLGESGMLSEGEREELNRRLELDPGMLDGLVGSSVERLLGKVYRRCGEVIELYVRDMLLGEVKGLIREYEAVVEVGVVALCLIHGVVWV